MTIMSSQNTSHKGRTANGALELLALGAKNFPPPGFGRPLIKSGVEAGWIYNIV